MGKAEAIESPFTHSTRREVRTQFAAIPWRVKEGKLRVMLVKSRGSGRWIVPKGWPMPGKSAAESAAIEAFEEAGVTGTVSDTPLGVYSYLKADVGDEGDLPCMVTVFPLAVEKKHNKFPEMHERTRKWVTPKKAAKLVEEPELKTILKGLAENVLQD